MPNDNVLETGIREPRRLMEFIPIIIPERRASTRAERRLEYRCEHCGFSGIARVFGRGSATGSVFRATVEIEAQAHATASAEGDALLPLRSCPRCSKRNVEQLTRFQRVTWLIVGSAVVGVIAILALSMREKTSNTIVNVILGIIGIAAISIIPFFRAQRLVDVDKRVTFLSPEQLAAEAEEAAKEVAEREEARRARQRRAKKRLSS